MESTTRYNPRYTNTLHYNIPDRQAPGETVNKIFLKASSGRAFDIMASIIQERSLLNLLDQQNRSILHHILLNNDLSKDDKYDLIKKSVELGAPVDTPDIIKGVRPIHLATGQQNRKVVRYLLSKKADPNSKTFNFMTPLHYAVIPENTICPANQNKTLIADTESSTQEFHTDLLFKSVFDLFKNDKTVQMYIKHVADIFRYRFVYDNLSNDEKEFTNIIKGALEERSSSSLNEKIHDHIAAFKNSLYMKTRSELPLTINLHLDIKEDTPGGWSPLFNGIHDDKLAILPFANLKDAFTENHTTFEKARDSKIGEILGKMKSTRKIINDMKKYLIDTNNMIGEFESIFKVADIWKKEINVHFNNDGKIISLLNALTKLFSVNNLTINVQNIPTVTFENTDNFAKIKIPETTILKYNNVAKNTIFNNITTNRSGLGVILEYYFNDINNKFQLLETIATSVKNSIISGKDINDHDNTFFEIGDFQYYLLNILYALIHFDNRAQKLSAVLEQFRTTIIDQNLQPVVNYVSNIINGCIDDINTKNTISHYNTYQLILDNDGVTLRRVLKHENINITYYNYDNISIVAYKFKNKYIFAKAKTHAAVKIAANTGLIPAANDYAILDHMGTFIEYIHGKNMGSNIIKIETKLNINNRLETLIESGEFNQNGHVGRKNLVNALYLSLVEVQTKMNGVISIYNKENGYNFSRLFNNNMNDSTYAMLQSDNFFYVMFNTLKLLKSIPDTYIKFNNKYRPMIMQGGQYSPNNAANTVKKLIDTYGLKISASDKTEIVRPPTLNEVSGITISQHDGIVSSKLSKTPKASLIQNGVSVGNPLQYITNGPNRFNKFTDSIENISIISSVFDEHIYIIKLILLMYMTQQFANIYERGTMNKELSKDQNNVYQNMKNLYDELNDVSSLNPLGTVLAVSTKMVDDIYVSTIENISNLGASNYVRYIATRQEITNVPTQTLLANAPTNNLDEKAQLIVKPSKKVILHDRDMILSVVSSGFHELAKNPGSLDVGMLNIFKLDEKDNDTDTHRMINYDSVDISNDVCYNINEDIIGDLLSAGAGPNILARSGETPLSLAIIIQNENIIDTLLRSGAKVSNSYNMCFNQLLGLIESSPIMEIDDIDYRVRDHLRKISGMRSVFANSKFIIKMTAYMFVHQLTLISNTYPNMWTREGQTNILSMLDLINVDRDFIPLAKVDLSLIDENLQGYSTLNDLTNEYNSKLIEARETYIRIDNSINNLNKEEMTLSANDAYRQSEITTLVEELKKQRDYVNSQINDLVQKIDSIRLDKVAASNVTSINITKTAIQGSSNLHSLIKTISRTKNRDVCNVYDVFFNKIISASSTDIYNNEYNTYLKVWNDLLSRPESELKTDHTQMISILMQRIITNGVMEPNMFVDVYQPISDLYDKVLSKYGRDLVESMPYLSKDNNRDNYEFNYVLKQIYCIMYHVFKHTMSINFINTVAQLLVRRDRGGTESSIMRNVYQDMKSSEFIKYVIVTLPKLVIKIVCKISESEKDPDLSLSVTDVLNKALDRLTLSTFESIDKPTIEQAKELIVPFFVNYMEAYTAEMYSFMIKQCKMMIAQGRVLRILNMLAPKAILEKSGR